ncbi:unnamed protein product [marine sediment metagenome]|uniref:Uncharacterized protein n=1 Tax=marine sediment metagenome TaxID=412755 RepID=X0YS51_9ZZZZ
MDATNNFIKAYGEYRNSVDKGPAPALYAAIKLLLWCENKDDSLEKYTEWIEPAKQIDILERLLIQYTAERKFWDKMQNRVKT